MDLRVGGKWKLQKKLGSGAFGEIYQGKNINLFMPMLINNDFLNRRDN